MTFRRRLTIFLAAAFLTAAVLPIAAAPVAAACSPIKVKAWEHTNRGGEVLELCASDSDLTNNTLNWWTSWNDAISSLQVYGTNVTAYFYSHTGYYDLRVTARSGTYKYALLTTDNDTFSSIYISGS